LAFILAQAGFHGTEKFLYLVGLRDYFKKHPLEELEL
jgi:hypothetical protein